MAATRPILTLERPQLGRTVVRLGAKIVASIEPFQNSRGPARWIILHLPDVPERTLRGDNDNHARDQLAGAVTDWCVGIGWLLPGDRVEIAAAGELREPAHG